MITKKEARQLAHNAENFVYYEKQDIEDLIRSYAFLGLYELEVFATKKLVKKIKPILEKRGFYVHETAFDVLKEESMLYISWISSF